MEKWEDHSRGALPQITGITDRLRSFQTLFVNHFLSYIQEFYSGVTSDSPSCHPRHLHCECEESVMAEPFLTPSAYNPFPTLVRSYLALLM